MAAINGTEGNDTLTGTEGPDTIEGLGGSDTVEGGGGDDTIRGGAGYDILWGGIGNDSIEAGDGGGEIYGEAGNDVLTGGTGSDYIWDGAGNDVVDGGAGDDVLRSSWYQRGGISMSPSGSDTLYGGEGNDLILVHRENHQSGDTVRAYGNAGRDTIDIGSYGGLNAFLVDAGADDDTIIFRSESEESFTGYAGSGNDLVFFELLTGAVTLTLGTGTDTVRIGQSNADRVGRASIVIEDFAGGASGDRIDFDTFVAASLIGWDPASNPFGSGHLRLVGHEGSTYLQIDRDGGGSAHGFVNLVVFRGIGYTAITADNLDGYDPSGAPMPGKTIVGTEGPDKLSGTGAADTIDGLGGNDVIEGGGSDDTIRGGAGYDVIWGGMGSDRLEAGDGGGEIFGEQGHDNIIGGSGADVIWDGAGDDKVAGGGGDDELRSSWYRRDEASVAATGSDTLDGGEGNDLIIVRREMYTSGDTVRAIGGAGNDIIDVVSGGTHSFVLEGGAGNDQVLIRSENVEAFTVSAGDGADLVFLDLLTGSATISLGAAADVLRLGRQMNLRLGTAVVAVEDFETGAAGDRLDFDVFLADTLIGWDGSANPFGTGHLQLLQSGVDTVLRLDRDGGAGTHAFVPLVTFRNVSAQSFTIENLDGFAPTGVVVEGRTVTGTEGPDALQGTAGGDTIDGLGGNDVVEAGAGDDLVRGGAGADILWGGLGHDRVEAGDGGGDMYGEQGHDVLVGGSGADRIWDGAGDDVVTGGAGNDELRSASYWRNDAGVSASGSDRLDGGEGDDLILVHRDETTNGDAVSAIGGAGRDTIDILSHHGRNTYTVDAGADDDTIILLSGQNETFFIDAGTGADTVEIDYIAGSAAITLGAGADVLRIGQFQRNHLATASIAVTDFAAEAGGDRLDFDVFVADALIGWDGTANPFAAGYLRLVQSGADTLLQIDRDAAGGAHAMTTLVTFRGVDPASFTAASLDGYAPILGITGGDQADSLSGTSANDRIDGRGGDDTLDGREGDDSLSGGTGADRLTGGAGADTFVYSHVYDSFVAFGTDQILDFTPGTDRIDLEPIDTSMDAGDQDFAWIGTAAFSGNGTPAQLRAVNHGGNQWSVESDLDGNGTADFAIRVAATGAQALKAGDFLGVTAAPEPEPEPESGPIGDDGDNVINGTPGDDSLEGRGGNDTLHGARGGDTLSGGTGADTFQYRHVFDSFLAFGTDRILDFTPGTDKIDLAQIDTSMDAGDQDFAWIGTAAFSGDGTPAQLRVVSHGGNQWSVESDLDGNGTADFAIRVTATDAQALKASDFLGVTAAAEPPPSPIGDDGDNVINGSAGDDSLEGRGGNDTLTGGRGGDSLSGGSGADTFLYGHVFDSFVAWPVDQILDFTPGSDRIDLSQIDTMAAAGDQAFTFIGGDAFSANGTPAQLRVVSHGGNLWSVESDLDGNGTTDFMIWVTATGPQPLTASDFVL